MQSLGNVAMHDTPTDTIRTLMSRFADPIGEGHTEGAITAAIRPLPGPTALLTVSPMEAESDFGPKALLKMLRIHTLLPYSISSRLQASIASASRSARAFARVRASRLQCTPTRFPLSGVLSPASVKRR